MERKYFPDFGVLVPHPPSKPPEPKPPALSHRHRPAPVRTCAVNEQMGIYSDIITKHKFQSLTAGPGIMQRSLGRSIVRYCDPNTTKVTTLKTPSDQGKHVEKQNPGPTSQQSQQSQTSYFPRGGDSPKVQIPYQTARGQVPRKLEIERRRREYLKLDIEQLLAEQGIYSNLLMPTHQSSSDDHETTTDNPVSPYLSLEVFDNEDFECRNPEDWLALGIAEKSLEQKPIPAKALLPTDDEINSDEPQSSSLEYSWRLVAVLDYSKEKCQYLVQKVCQNSQLTDKKGRPILNEEHKKSKSPAGTTFWVPRIRLVFSAEDPRVFVKRIQFALRWQENTEALLLYHLSVDCMPTWKGTPSLDSHALQRIRRITLSAPGLRHKILEKCIGDLEKELKLDYERTMNRMSFDRVVMRHPEEFSHITLPQKGPAYVPQSGRVPVPTFPYEKYKTAFFFKSLLTKPEVIRVLSEILSECNKVANMRLFNVTSVKPLRLDEFEVIQAQMHTQVSLFLREGWIVSLSNCIRFNLLSIGRGTYNVDESQWEMYKMSKLYRLMAVVRYKLQDSMRHLVQASLLRLTLLLLTTCHSVLTCPQDLVWGDDLVTSPYKSERTPLFLLDLILDQTGVHYSTPLENFKTSMVNLFDKAILATYKVPQLDKFVMQKMFVGGDPLLESVNLWEPEVTALREKVSNAMMQGVIPLRAYAAEYEKYLDLHNLDIETLLKSPANAEQTSQEVKKEVEQHLKDKETLEHSLPSSIVIGTFVIRVEGVRQALSNKKKALANAMLAILAGKLSKQVDEACEEYNTISRKLREKLNSIEELSEKREWMKQVPGQLKSYKEVIGKTLSDYELIEELRYSLSNEDFDKKWTAIRWPQKIISQMEAAAAQHLEDEERFNKIQLADQNNFEDHLDSLKMLVAGIACHDDINHAHKVANKVRRTSKQLKDCLTMAQTYNTRERLFGIPVTNYDRLQKLVKDFQPFTDLWTTTSDWMRWHENWLNDPLSSIDSEQLERNVTDVHKVMNKCVKHFKDIPGCQMVASAICIKIKDFQPYIPLIQGLRNPGMKNRHWEILSDRIQMKVKPKDNLTLSRCLELGLQNHIEDIAHVAEVAGKEYTIEQALDKMENEWSTIFFDVLPYKDTGTYILKSPDEVSQMLDDHNVMTQSMSFSPFKKSFEARINTWEGKIRMTQDVLEEWLTFQRSWLYLEPIFSSDDITQQLPVEGKRYQLVDRTWKAVMKSAFKNPKVIELCPDSRLLEKLKRCNELLEEVQKGLSEYLETKRGSFPRFYFLSDDELLEILSQTRDPTAVQPHLNFN